ncbi:MAG: CoA transferase, partial [Boseongicola sp.]
LQRNQDGEGHAIRVGLFENCLLLVSQHMVQFDIEGREAPPMPEREFSWPVYDIFETKEGRQLFVGAVTEGQWANLCDILGLDQLKNDAQLQNRMDQIKARDWTLPIFTKTIADRGFEELCEAFEPAGIPFSPIHRPAEMYDDPHVNRPGGLFTSKHPGEIIYRAPGFPFEVDGNVPQPFGMDIADIGDDTNEVLASLGLDKSKIVEASGAANGTAA